MLRKQIYFNLHKRLFSIQEKGKVIDHTNNITLWNCRFLVGEKGRDRVRQEGKKNVHAKVSGFIERDKSYDGCDRVSIVKYNPYVNDTFVREEDNSPIHYAKVVNLFLVNGKPCILAYE